MCTSLIGKTPCRSLNHALFLWSTPKPGYVACALAVLGLASHVAAQEDIVSALAREVQRHADSMPENTVCDHPMVFPKRCLINSMEVTGRFLHSPVDPNDVDVLSAAWGLPAAVMEQLRWILLVDSVAFNTFTVVVDGRKSSGSLVEYIGAARRHNGVANVAITHVAVHGKLHQQYSTHIPAPFCSSSTCCPYGAPCVTPHVASAIYPNKRCVAHPSLYALLCREDATMHYFANARGFTALEIDRIVQAMRATAYRKLSALISQGASQLSAVAERL